MRILLIGSGGREHAIAWKLSQSSKLTQLFNLPGNPGTAKFGKNISGDILDVSFVVKKAKELEIDLVIVGPEDLLGNLGIRNLIYVYSFSRSLSW